MTSESQHLIADKSGHNVELDQPEAAIGAMLKLVEQVRRRAMP